MAAPSNTTPAVVVVTLQESLPFATQGQQTTNVEGLSNHILRQNLYNHPFAIAPPGGSNAANELPWAELWRQLKTKLHRIKREIKEAGEKPWTWSIYNIFAFIGLVLYRTVLIAWIFTSLSSGEYCLQSEEICLGSEIFSTLAFILSFGMTAATMLIEKEWLAQLLVAPFVLTLVLITIGLWIKRSG